MPYADNDKKKAYYERHKRFYDKKFKQDHADDWNRYQRKYKVQQRVDRVNNIKSIVRELNVTDEKDLGFQAAVICLLMITEGISSLWAIAYRTGYSLENVKLFINNWRESGLYDGKYLHMEEYNNDMELGINLACISLCATGEIKAVRIS